MSVLPTVRNQIAQAADTHARAGTRTRRPRHHAQSRTRSALGWMISHAGLGVAVAVALAVSVIALTQLSGSHTAQPTIRSTPPASPTPGGFPPRVYPPPARYPHWGSPDACASTRGLRSPGRTAAAQSVHIILSLNGHLQHHRHLSDRALWPTLQEDQTSPTHTIHTIRRDIVSAGPARSSPYAALVRHQCGQALLRLSTRVVIGPPASSPRRDPALLSEIWVIDRDGHWLAWFQNP
jgi:hypothetical protein